MPSVTFPVAGTDRSGRRDGASSVGARLAVRRVHCGLSISALADATGLSPESIARAESGTLDLGDASYGAMARVLGVPEEDLLRPVPAVADSERSLEAALAKRIASIRDESVRRVVIALLTTVAAAEAVGRGDDPARQDGVGEDRGAAGRKPPLTQ